MALFTACPLAGKADSGSPVHHLFSSQVILISAQTDTLPENKNDNRKNDNKDATLKIKEVPKAHKQLKPIAVPNIIPIKPVQIIKPKIIKPVVRIH